MNNKVAIVTGGSRGIGAATAKILAERGAKVIVNYMQNRGAAQEVVDTIQLAGGKAIALQADARDSYQMQQLVEEALRMYGTVDILVHNAGMSFVKKSFEDMTWEEFSQKVNDELQAAFVSTKVVVPQMKQQQYGRLIYISSGLSHQPTPNFIAHGSSKGGLNSFVKYIAKEFASYHITANVVSPGLVETDATSDLPPTFKQHMEAMLPLGRLGRPEDIAKAVAFYASDDSAYLTGSYMPVSGGGEMN
ncbi:3-oxoacyl-[acyl-carrier protein] reductase [Paenibacillus shirakamiensis]|uniref:3-oxoacyl-[acyl-carrier protein] reductase n=1 Tax=Paenibacillus shirakamiensis TaxID=1265935 RepID=A0ABS4JJT7_9BACL|nr:SDR family oxidoreductase [Paenibacillus shirakamiensis]MBP2001975.1 3-oxoacyl-[acyl-carrier protein] reductase [Paenibacillus shirakamiensis]